MSIPICPFFDTFLSTRCLLYLQNRELKTANRLVCHFLPFYHEKIFRTDAEHSTHSIPIKHLKKLYAVQDIANSPHRDYHTKSSINSAKNKNE